MKNQNDLIITIVTVVLALIAITAFYFTKPVVNQPAAPEKVLTADPQMPQGDVQFSTSLPGAAGGGAGGAGAAGPARGGGRGPGGSAERVPTGVTGAGG